MPNLKKNGPWQSNLTHPEIALSLTDIMIYGHAFMGNLILTDCFKALTSMHEMTKKFKKEEFLN